MLLEKTYFVMRKSTILDLVATTMTHVATGLYSRTSPSTVMVQVKQSLASLSTACSGSAMDTRRDGYWVMAWKGQTTTIIKYR